MIPKIPSIRKHRKLKPLDLGNVIVALINQQHKIDNTIEYKRMLSGKVIIVDGQSDLSEKQLVLPEFAEKELSQSEILDYLIKNRIRDTEEYEKILMKVDQKIKIAIFQYSDKLKQGQNVIQELKCSLSQACELISNQRKYVVGCMENIKRSYSKIGPTLRKINNIKQVMQVMQIWKQSKLPYIFEIDVEHPYRYNIEDVINLFNVAEQKINRNVQISKSYPLKKILFSIRQKHKKFINCIYQQFIDSVIKYNNAQEYQIKYQQYLYLREKQLCGDILNIQGIKKLIQGNANTMFTNVLAKYTTNMNVDLLNQNVYMDFYDQVAEEFVIYFRSWHHVTTFHLDNNTSYGHLFLQSRKLVFLTLSNRISTSIENSNKFISLQYKIKLQLIEMLHDYIESGEKWMGSCQSLQLPRVVVNKLNKELENIFGLYNNLIKNILSQELSVVALKSVDEVHPGLKINHQKGSLSEINYLKIASFLSLCTSSKNTQLQQNNIHDDNNFPQIPEVKLKIGSTFAQMIVQYLERSKYLQKNKLVYINKIVQHFQFILFMMFQVCTTEALKQKLHADIEAKLILLQQEKGEEISIKEINELSKLANFKRMYGQILQFLNSVGSKYNGVKIAGIIDVNKVYQRDNVQIIQGYTKLVARVVADLLKILRWLIECIPNTKLKDCKQCTKLNKLLQMLILLFRVIIENNVEIVNKKYLQSVGTVISKLKWQIKKFNQEMVNSYKQYRDKLIKVFRNNSVGIVVKGQVPQLADFIQNKQVEILYRSLLECYGKIQKINDNGRQLIRMDSIDVSKTLKNFGIKTENWQNWFDRYLDFTVERSYKSVLEKIIKIGTQYQPSCWKYQLMWVVSDFSSKEKKQYNTQLAKIYLGYLSEVR